jgi:hypothetical protein
MGTAIAGGGVSYALPQAVEIGPVEIDDPNGVVSDELVFGPDSMAFYSLDCVGKLADTCGFLPEPGPVVATEATDGSFVYLAGGAFPTGNAYHGQSDAVPEPASLTVLRNCPDRSRSGPPSASQLIAKLAALMLGGGQRPPSLAYQSLRRELGRGSC